MRPAALAIAVAALVGVSLSGAAEQAPDPVITPLPEAKLPAGVRPLGPGGPPWARRLYRQSVRVLLALTDPRTGTMIAAERSGWDYVWPRDAGAGAIALEAAGLHGEARRVASFLAGLDLDEGARFQPDGDAVPGRPEAGDAAGWVAAAERATGLPVDRRSGEWRERQDYGENATGDLLGNAIAAAAPAEIAGFETPRGLVREEAGDELDSAAAWAVTVFPRRTSRAAARRTLLEFVRESTPFGIPPIEGWTPGEVWTAPTAWSSWALTQLGETAAADRLLDELHRAATPQSLLPERLDASDGHPTSTTPLAWSHAFAILALRARYSVR
jgi:hypothetical protein